MDKATRYATLIRDRRACMGCPGMANAAKIDGGIFDCDEIGPLSHWQGNLNARLMVVLQDFADEDGFRKYRGRAGASVVTNQRLARYLAEEVGLPVRLPGAASDDGLFFTNAVLCMKAGGMGAALDPACVRRCGQRFLVPTIELVGPRVLVTLGGHALRAVWQAFRPPDDPAPDLADVVATPIPLTAATALMPLYHTSPRTRRYRSDEQQRADWRRVREQLAD